MSFGYTMMTNNIFSIALFGFSNIERTLIASVCKLSQARLQRLASHSQAGFQVVEPDSADRADILLVDGDNPDALQTGTWMHTQKSSAPLVMVTKAPTESSQPGNFVLARHRLGGMLLKSLDGIVQEWIQGGSAERTSPASSARKTCLVVDDSQLVRTQMEMILGAHPLAVEYAEDAETALQRVKQKTFDIIFLDVMLPEMNGYKACKLLKSDPNTSATPVVMLTSKKSPFNKMHGALVGCDKYLTKPVDESKVHQVLRQYDVIEEIASPQQSSMAAMRYRQAAI